MLKKLKWWFQSQLPSSYTIWIDSEFQDPKLTVSKIYRGLYYIEYDKQRIIRIDNQSIKWANPFLDLKSKAYFATQLRNEIKKASKRRQQNKPKDKTQLKTTATKISKSITEEF